MTHRSSKIPSILCNHPIIWVLFTNFSVSLAATLHYAYSNTQVIAEQLGFQAFTNQNTVITFTKNLCDNVLMCYQAIYLRWDINSYSASHDYWCTATLSNRVMTAQCEGMGEVVSVRYEPALLPPCPSIRVLSYSNCQEIHSRQQTGLAV